MHFAWHAVLDHDVQGMINVHNDLNAHLNDHLYGIIA